jgi:hypothetical protein
MRYKDPGYNRLLVADLYHWEKGDIGSLLVKENSNRRTIAGGAKNG